MWCVVTIIKCNMEYLSNLLEGYPNLWSGGVAHSVLILALVFSLGIVLG